METSLSALITPCSFYSQWRETGTSEVQLIQFILDMYFKGIVHLLLQAPFSPHQGNGGQR